MILMYIDTSPWLCL